MVVDLDHIRAVLPRVDLLAAMERAFTAYSEGRAVVPPVGELLFDDPPGDAHIKYGYLRGDSIFVIKVATGFYRNAESGLPSNSGLMLIFDSSTGLPSTVLLDQGHLTNVRTAAAGAVAAKYLAPAKVERIGICGTGVQARMQLEQLASVTACRKVLVWGRSRDKAADYAGEMGRSGFDVEVASSPAAIGASCNLIVTATISEEPLLGPADIRPGTHITAMGSDTPLKNELQPALLARADLVVADSISQCRERGEVHHAIAAGLLDESRLVELGTVIARGGRGRPGEEAITIADLTGVAVQDIEICKAVLSALPRDAD